MNIVIGRQKSGQRACWVGGGRGHSLDLLREQIPIDQYFRGDAVREICNDDTDDGCRDLEPLWLFDQLNAGQADFDVIGTIQYRFAELPIDAHAIPCQKELADTLLECF